MKKAMVLLMAGVMVVLSACGGGDKNTATGDVDLQA